MILPNYCKMLTFSSHHAVTIWQRTYTDSAKNDNSDSCNEQAPVLFFQASSFNPADLRPTLIRTLLPTSTVHRIARYNNVCYLAVSVPCCTAFATVLLALSVPDI